MAERGGLRRWMQRAGGVLGLLTVHGDVNAQENEFYASPVPAVERSLQVMTYNTWGLPFPLASSPRSRRLPRIGRFLQEAQMDVVGLQEVWTGAPQLLRLDGLRLGRREAGDSGLAIWSRHPVRTLHEEIFDAARGFDSLKKKGVLMAEVAVESSEPVHVLVTHLQAGGGDANARVRAKQVDQVLDLVEKVDGPVILMGDFNFHRDTPADQASITRLAGAGLIDAAEKTGSLGPTFPRHGRRYDRVLLRGGPARSFEVDGLSVVEEAGPLSDHLPVKVGLRLRAALRNGAGGNGAGSHSAVDSLRESEQGG